MKKIIFSAFAAFALLATPPARAWTYSDGHALLIFRANNFNTLEFDLGNISQFLNKSNGYTTVVTNWDLNLVTSTYGSDLTGVSIVLLATTSPTNASPTAWLSGVEPITTAYNVTPSVWSAQLYSIINSIGTRPGLYQAPSAGPSAYSFLPSYVAAYDNVASSGGQFTGALPFLGGNSPFQVELAIPGSFELSGVQPSLANPKPADTLVGRFTITAAGALTFIAGPPPSTIVGITRAGGVNGISFTTTVGGNYQLVYTNVLGAPASEWPAIGSPIAGDGTTKSLNHTNNDASGFYRVVRAP